MMVTGDHDEVGLVGARPLVTVYVPSHGYGHFLRQAIESVLAQIYPNWELIVIDDGSTDDTSEVAERYVGLHPERIRLIRNDVPKGLQVVANRVLHEANGRYLVRLDADDWFDESALLVLVARAEAEDSPAIVYGGFHYVDETGRLLGTETRNGLLNDAHRRTNPPHGAGTLVNVEELRAVDGYATDVDAQDGWDLWFKLIERVHVASVATPLFFYRQHGSSLSRSEERLYRARSRILARRPESRADGPMSILAVIPARSSNQGIEDVPFREIAGLSVLERAILEAQSCRGVTNVIVTADDQRIIEHSEQLERDGRVAPHMRAQRPVGTKGTNVPLSSILRHAGEYYERESDDFPDVVMFLSINAVLRTATEIDNVIDTLRVTGVETVVSVSEERNPVFIHSADGLRIVGNGRFDDLLYRDEQLLRFNGIAIAARWPSVAEDRLWVGAIASAEMPRELGLILENEESLDRAERILSTRMKLATPTEG